MGNGNSSSRSGGEVDELIYFNVSGRAEVIRILYTMYNKPFKDTRIEYGGEEWKAMQNNMPYRTLPMLKRGTLVLNQNIPIAHLLAKEFGLVGHNWEEQALEEAVVSKLEELGNKGADVLVFEPDPVRKEQDGKKFLEQTLPTGLQCLEDIIKNNTNGNGYFVGNKLKWCDIYFYCVADRFIPTNAALLEPYPHLKTLHDRIKALPGVKKWVNRATSIKK